MNGGIAKKRRSMIRSFGSPVARDLVQVCQAEAPNLTDQGRFIMALTRRAFAAATAAGVAAPTIARAKECPAAGMDWMTMSLEARNLAYFNVAHVGADFARQKTEHWTAASKDLRERRPKHLDLAYRPGERTKWDLYPAADPKAPCFVHIHGGSGSNSHSYWEQASNREGSGIRNGLCFLRRSCGRTSKGRRATACIWFHSEFLCCL